MPLHTLRSWLGLARNEPTEHPPLRELVDALDQMDPGRARHLARFAFLLGRVARADQRVSPEETHTMESSLMREGGLTADQAVLVVGLAKSSNLLFGGTADYEVALEFGQSATYDEKLALTRSLFAVAATDAAISLNEETEIHRIAVHLKILPEDLTALRVQHRQFLPGLASPQKTG